MKTKIRTALTVITILSLGACGGSNTNEENKESAVDVKSLYNEVDKQDASGDTRGIGKFKDITLSETLNTELALKGKDVYELKCAACHRLEGDRLVGPSWDGVTTRREPAWILNFITNVDEMLSKDPVAMAQLEECLVRMPNQNLSDEDAYAVLEYMRENDGIK